MFELESVGKAYGETVSLTAATLTIEDGEFFVLVGSSGSGKTTLLKLLNRLIEPTEGTIRRGGKAIRTLPLRPLRLDTGYVLQQIALFPNLTVAENIALVPMMKGLSKAETIEQTRAWLTKLGLPPQEYMHRYPRELSGGQQQRVGIIRSLIGKPQVLLMDEPFSALDPLSRRQLQELIKALHREFGLTIVFVTHDMAEALCLGSRLCIMENGRIIRIGTPSEIKENPQSDFVRQLFSLGGDSHE